MAFDVGATPGRTLLTSWASSISAGVAPGQPAGTDNLPRVLAWPTPADTGEPLKPRPANCGVGYQAPPEPAVVPIPNVVCWPMLQPKFPRPVPKYACPQIYLKLLMFALVSPRPNAPGGLSARVFWMNC